jgi:hypothetical protein
MAHRHFPSYSVKYQHGAAVKELADVRCVSIGLSQKGDSSFG